MINYQPWATAPRNGFGFLAYGIHTTTPPGAARGVRPGDHWWAILQFDIWREPHQFVFAKDGTPAWSEPKAWAELTIPGAASGQ
jgi:hypothetical protein